MGGRLAAGPRGWLLILDNVNDPADVEPLLGQLTGGHIVITTRRDTGWDQIADPIRLDVLDPGPATDLIAARTGSHDPAGVKVPRRSPPSWGTCRWPWTRPPPTSPRPASPWPATCSGSA